MNNSLAQLTEPAHHGPTNDSLIIQNLRQQLADALQLLGRLPEFSQSTMEDHIYITTNRRLQKVHFQDILWIESDRNYVTIYTSTQVYAVHLPISKVEEKLPKSLFSRIHKSFIVASRKVDFIRRNQVGLRREHETKLIPLGAQFKKSFIQSFGRTILKHKSYNY